MDANVTGGAVLVSRIRHIVGRRLRRHALASPAEARRSVVTFQAEREYYGAPQHAGIR